MNFALMFLLKFLAYIGSLVFLFLALSFALIGMILRMPGNIVVLMSNGCFLLGNRIAKWLLLNKLKAALKEIKK